MEWNEIERNDFFFFIGARKSEDKQAKRGYQFVIGLEVWTSQTRSTEEYNNKGRESVEKGEYRVRLMMRARSASEDVVLKDRGTRYRKEKTANLRG